MRTGELFVFVLLGAFLMVWVLFGVGALDLDQQFDPPTAAECYAVTDPPFPFTQE